MALAQNKSREFVVAEGDKRCCSGKEMGNSHKWATATTVRSLTQDCGRGNVKETVICPTPGGLVERQSSGPELPSRVNTNHRPSRRPESVPRLPPNCGKSSTHFIPECLHGNMRLFDVDPSSDFIINSYKYESSSDTSSKRLLIGDKTIKTMATYKSVDRLREHRSVSNGKKNGKDEDYESDSSEELQYGPGIVNKLKTKYLSLTLRENQRRGVRPSLNNLRRAASLENILDEEAKVSQTKTPTYFKKSTHNATVSKNSKVSQYCARYMNINKGSDSMKRAQSMDALFRNEVKSVPCSLTKSLTVDARLSNGNDVVIIDRAPQPPKVPPKPDVDKDLPPPDVVKQTLKIFEKSTTSPRKPDVSIVPKVKAVKVIQERPKAPVDKRRPLVKPSVLPKPVLSSDRFSQNKKEPVPCSTPDKIAPQPCFVFMKDLEVPDVSPIRKETLAEATNTLVSEPERPAVQQPVAAQRPPPRPVDSPKQVAIIRPVVNKVPVPPKPSSPPPPVSVPSPPQPPVTPPLTHVEIEKNLINRSRTDSPQEDSPKISLWDTKAWNGQNTVVFDFSNRKEIPDYIESDGVTEKKDKKVNGDLSLDDEDLVDSPLSCQINIIGGNIVINGKSNLRKQPKQHKLRIQFDKSAPSLFEYPREDGEETPTSPTAPTASLLPSTGGNLCSYTPSKTVDRFELGVSRSPTVASSKCAETEEVVVEPPPPWSSHEATSDILF